MNITTRQFQLLSDVNLVWDFLTDIYDRKIGSGVAAPFFEYALQSSWMDQSYSFLDRFWLDGDRVVAFVFYEAPVTDIFFSVRKGYEFLADELVDYAVSTMPNFDGKQRLVLFNGQEFLMEAAARRGFVKTEEYEDRNFDFRNELDHPLPEGYRFVDPKDADGLKLAKLLWYGFGHGEKGPFEGWDREDCSNDWTPAKSYKGVIGPMTAPAPHSTHEYDVIIADENGEYVCFSGMWWVPENKLAYMEPLCTHPDHRRRGLAAAALSRHYHRMRALGATHMTGGGDPFYEKLGYGKGIHWTFWKRDKPQRDAEAWAEGDDAQLFKTAAWWEELLKNECGEAREITVREAECFDIAWQEWFKSDHEYGIRDREFLQKGLDGILNFMLKRFFAGPLDLFSSIICARLTITPLSTLHTPTNPPLPLCTE